MDSQRVIIVGGGAAGFFAAITCAETAPGNAVTILERGPEFLAKVRVSGGGRCNVTHACFEAREFVTRYPRGAQELIGPFRRFGAHDTVDWFQSRGVRCYTQPDGCLFGSGERPECLPHALSVPAVGSLDRCLGGRVQADMDHPPVLGVAGANHVAGGFQLLDDTAGPAVRDSKT